MEPLTIIGYIIAALVVVVPVAYNYSRKLGIALEIIYQIMNIVSSYMKGDIDHEFTTEEKLDLADKVIALCKNVDQRVDIDAVLNFFYKKDC